MATTYNFTDGSLAGQKIATRTTMRENETTILRHILDFSLQSLDAGEGDVAKALIIPANTSVFDVFIRVITAETGDGTVNLGYGSDTSYWGKSLHIDAIGSVSTMLKTSAVWDLGSIDDHDTSNAIVEAKDITLVGAALGDYAFAYPSIDVTDMIVAATVTAEDTVTVTVTNPTGAAINLASMTMYVAVDKAPSRKSALYFAAADTIDLMASTANGDIDIDGAKLEVTALCLKHLDNY